MNFSRIAIVNRGEPAMRAIHAISELALELPADLRSIALYTDPDEQAMFVREADERYGLGAATFVDPARRSGQELVPRPRATGAGAAVHQG